MLAKQVQSVVENRYERNAGSDKAQQWRLQNPTLRCIVISVNMTPFGQRWDRITAAMCSCAVLTRTVSCFMTMTVV